MVPVTRDGSSGVILGRGRSDGSADGSDSGMHGRDGGDSGNGAGGGDHSDVSRSQSSRLEAFVNSLLSSPRRQVPAGSGGAVRPSSIHDDADEDADDDADEDDDEEDAKEDDEEDAKEDDDDEDEDADEDADEDDDDDEDAGCGRRTPSSVTSPELPAEIEEADWGGVDIDTVLRCFCGLQPRRKVCYAGKDTGRRFYGCPLEEDEEQCKFVRWVDESWPERAQKSFVNLWKTARLFRKDGERTRAELNVATALRNEALEEKESLTWETQLEIARTKTLAACVCRMYQGKMRREASERAKVALEKEKVALEKEKAVSEKERAWMVITALVAIVVVLACILLFLILK
ncbi:hypothetical protein EJB05_50901, partial [Eragrostis curvula]